MKENNISEPIHQNREKVCLFLRCSTNVQDYEYQRDSLNRLCVSRNWEIVATFENKVSGAKKTSERPEVQALIDYVKNNKVDRVVCTEISRLGRNTLEALKVIEVLNENKVCLYLANYGLETLDKNGKVNPVASLICTILLEVSSIERSAIRDRMQLGYAHYLEKRKTEQNLPLGRPTNYKKSETDYKVQYTKEVSLLRKGLSLRNVNQITGTAIGTLQRIKSYI